MNIQAFKSNTEGKKVVFVSGNFNLIHPGHLRLFRFARECGDILLVGVNSDKQAGLALMPEAMRLEHVQAISWVDEAFLLDVLPEEFIIQAQPDIVIKGKEYEDQENAEFAAVKKYGGKLIFGSGDVAFSSVDLLRKAWESFDPHTIKKPDDYPVRHGFSNQDLLQTISRFKDLRVMIIGDTIVDEYIACDPLGLSQEDPTIVVTPVGRNKYLGGAAIVAGHASGLGAKVSFFTCLGNDETAEFVSDELKKLNVDSFLYPDESRPTSLKQRFRAGSKTLLRVSYLRQHAIAKQIRARMLRDIRKRLRDVDLVLFSDFNYGLLPQTFLEEILDECQKLNVPTCADSQSSSQIGDISRFHNQLLVTPTEREARLAVQDHETGLVLLAEKLRKLSNTQNVVITLGAEGLLIHAPGKEGNDWETDRLPAMNLMTLDVAGAGDSLFTTASMALISGADIWQACYLGSLAAACQVGRIGNLPLSVADLHQEINI